MISLRDLNLTHAVAAGSLALGVAMSPASALGDALDASTFNAPTPTVAEAVDAPEKPAWMRNLVPQLNDLLGEPDPEVRAGAMQVILQLRQEYGNGLDLRMVAPALVDLYRTEPNAQHRMLILTALHATRHRLSVERVAQMLRTEPSDRVQTHGKRVLALTPDDAPAR